MEKHKSANLYLCYIFGTISSSIWSGRKWKLYSNYFYYEWDHEKIPDMGSPDRQGRRDRPKTQSSLAREIYPGDTPSGWQTQKPSYVSYSHIYIRLDKFLSYIGYFGRELWNPNRNN